MSWHSVLSLYDPFMILNRIKIILWRVVFIKVLLGAELYKIIIIHDGYLIFAQNDESSANQRQQGI